MLAKSTIERESIVNFCKKCFHSIFISLQLDGANLIQSLLNLSHVVRHWLFFSPDMPVVLPIMLFT